MENENVLDELSKGACMGVDAINFILDKVEDQSFKEYLTKQKDTYDNIKKEIDDIYPKYSEKKPHETNAINKAMTWYGIEMKTLTDQSNSKIAELLLQGTNMGIIEGRKILNNKKMNEDVHQIAEEYVTMQESAVEVFKKYL